MPPGVPPPDLVEGPVTVTVPATSANLGPGFDSLGLALDLRDTLRAEVTPGESRVTVEGEGAGDVPLTEAHLVHVAMRAAFEAMQVPVPAVTLHCDNVVPHSRGLGSSSAAIVGGIMLARALVTTGHQLLPDAAALGLAIRLEGHPDNVSPALYGGFTIAARGAAPGSELFQLVRLDVVAGVGAVLFVPPSALSTATARSLLPEVVPHADAAGNAARAALLVVALTGHPETLLVATDDALHQDYRRPAMPESMALVDALRADGVAAVVSGAGPSVLALGAPTDLEPLRGRTPAGWASYTPVVGGPGARVEPPD